MEPGDIAALQPGDVAAALTPLERAIHDVIAAHGQIGCHIPNDRPWSDGGSYGSGYGRCVDLYAPGQKVTAALSGGGTATVDEGATSWAAPHATGVIALYLSAHPHATAREVHVWLDHTATRGVLHGVRSDTPNRLLNTGGI